MFNHTHYVPALKLKQGELTALLNTPATSRAAFTPLLEIEPPVLTKKRQSVDDCINAHLMGLRNSWSANHRTFIDMLFWEPPYVTVPPTLRSGLHPLEDLIGKAISQGLQAVPTTSFNRSLPYQQAIVNLHAQHRVGACIRVAWDFIQLNAIATALPAFVATLGLTPSDVDLILDLETVTPTDFNTKLTAVAQALSSLPIPADWRSLTVLSAAFPTDLSAVAGNSTGLFPRLDWDLWQQLVTQQMAFPRLPAFGDFAIQHPRLQDDFDPLTMSPSASIRYTVANQWYILKGRVIRSNRRRVGHGHQQYHNLANALVNSGHFYGPLFSWGDKQIDLCSRKQSGPGTPGTWRGFGTSHHIEVVIQQLSQVPVHGSAPSGGAPSSAIPLASSVPSGAPAQGPSTGQG